MTYLGKIDMTRESKIKAEEKFPISKQGYMVGKLLDGTNVRFCYTWEQANHFTQVKLFKMQIFTFFSKVCIKNSMNSSRKWTIH